MIKKTVFLIFILLFAAVMYADLKKKSYRFSDNYHLFLVSDSAKPISFSSYRLTSPDRVVVEIQGEILTQKLQKPSGPVTKIEVKDGGETLRLIFHIKAHSFYSILNRNNSVLLSFATIPLEDENDLTQAIATLDAKNAEKKQLIAIKAKSATTPEDNHAEEKMIAQLALSLKQQEKAEKERKQQAEIARIKAEKERKQQAEIARIAAEKEKQHQLALLKQKQEKERKQQAEIARIAAEKEKARLAEIARIEAEKEKIRQAEIARITAEKEKARLAEIRRIKVEQEKARQIALLKKKQEEEKRQQEIARKKAEEERLRLAKLEQERIEKERLAQLALLKKKQEEERKQKELALKKVEEERLRKEEFARIAAEKERAKQVALLKQKAKEKHEKQLALLKQKEEERNRKPIRKKMVKTADGTTVALKVSSPHADRSLDGKTPMLAVTTMRKEGVLNNLYFRKYPRFSRITMELTGDVDYQLKEIKGGFVINIYNFKVIPKRLLNIIDTRYFNSVIKYIYPKKIGDIFKIYVKTGKETAVRQSKEGLMVNFDFYTPTIK